MATIDGLVLTLVLNALWQIPAAVLAGFAGDRLLAQAPARLRHALWLAILAACVLLPAASLLRRDSSATPAPQDLEAAAGRTASPASWLAGIGRAPSLPAPVSSRAAAVAVYLYGLSLLLHGLRLGRALREARSLRREALPLEIPDAVAATVARCRAALHAEAAPLLASPTARGPATVGALRPAILLPESFFASASPDEAVAALGHEMAHVRRRDCAVHHLCEVLLLPVAFHPAVRLLRRRLAETREMACDEAVLETLIGRRAYARSLLALAASAAGLPRPSITLGVADARNLEVRMRRILDVGPRLGVRRARARLGAALLLLGGIAAAASVLSVQAIAGEPAAAGLEPFVGTWSGDWPLQRPGETKPRRAFDLEILPTGEIVQLWYRYEQAPDGSVKMVDKARQPVLSFKISGRTLTFTTRVEDFKFRDEPPAPAEIEGSIELRGRDEAVFRVLSHSGFAAAEKRGESVPPPPPPFPMKRIS
ncbi:MAG TPA: M56 family metallopeptidase [Thermoanaerobaculia bacterium]|jgi:beta-lactamase regulating signal transducer with metallopeptidase domain|nr:M56 family metallopeptidase [Thermoanaerobaculia bacterium]